MNLRIRFQGNDYLLVSPRAPSQDDALADGGAIATEEQYLNGEVSYASLNSDGHIRRFRQVIGHVSEISVLGVFDGEMTDSGVVKTILGIGWPSP